MSKSHNSHTESTLSVPEMEQPGYADDSDVKITTGTGKTSKRVGDITESQLYEEWYHRLAVGNPNDYVIVVTADPRYTGVSGSGKSTLGAGLAKWHLDFSPDGWDPEVQYTMSAGDILGTMYPETEAGACLIYDEAQGTPSSTGLNSKRSMKEDALNAINTVATKRKERKTLIVISQSLKALNKDLFDYVDAWLLIHDDINYVATHYDLHPDVFDLESNKIKTPGIEELEWDPLDENDPDYEHMEQVKDEASSVAQEAAGPQWMKRDRLIRAQALRDAGLSQREVSQDPFVDYSRNWISEHELKDAPDEREKPIRYDSLN